MKKLKLFMAAMVAAVTFAGMSGISAAAQSVAGSTATPHSFTITREVENVTNPVTNTFTYTVTPESGPEGGVSGAPTSATVAFNAVEPGEDSNTATATGTVDFGSAVFTKNGDYVWTITETGTDDATNYPKDGTHTYKIKAAVRNATSTNLSQNEGKQVTFFRLDSSGNKMGTEAQDPMLYTSAAQFKHIEISKTVTGAMADVDKYFAVDVTIGGTPGDSYTIAGQTGTGDDAGDTACTVANGATSCTATIKLKHGETVTIGKNGSIEQIPVTTEYSYAEQAATNYTATNGSASGKQVSATPSENQNAITNAYEGDTVTGVFLRILPYIVIVAIAVAGVIYLVVRNKKQKEVEE